MKVSRPFQLRFDAHQGHGTEQPGSVFLPAMTTGPDIFSQDHGSRIPIKQIEPQFDAAMATSEHDRYGVRRGRSRLGTPLITHEDRFSARTEPIGNSTFVAVGGRHNKKSAPEKTCVSHAVEILARDLLRGTCKALASTKAS
jgi:hypothetical protein